MRAHFKDMITGTSRRYGFAVAVVALALILGRLITPLSGDTSLYMLMLMAVALSAWYGGRGPGAAATLLATLAGVYLVLPQSWPLSIADSGDRLQLGFLLVEGLIFSVLIGTLQERLRRSEAALRARDDLLAVAAHELKTPLTAVIGYTQTLQQRCAREGQCTRRDQDTLRVIAGQARRLQTLIDSVLDLARLHNGQMQIAKQMLDLADDREPDPGSLHPAPIEVAGAEEPLKELGARCFGDANPLVADHQHGLRVLLFDADGDNPIGWAVFHGIVQQILK
jgi:K+-sensing histidine kinase KdpD